MKTEDGGEKAWIEALPGLKKLASIISAKGGPYCLGGTGTLWLILQFML
jgi:hypothetical protein